MSSVEGPIRSVLGKFTSNIGDDPQNYVIDLMLGNPAEKIGECFTSTIKATTEELKSPNSPEKIKQLSPKQQSTLKASPDSIRRWIRALGFPDSEKDIPRVVDDLEKSIPPLKKNLLPEFNACCDKPPSGKKPHDFSTMSQCKQPKPHTCQPSPLEKKSKPKEKFLKFTTVEQVRSWAETATTEEVMKAIERCTSVIQQSWKFPHLIYSISLPVYRSYFMETWENHHQKVREHSVYYLMETSKAKVWLQKNLLNAAKAQLQGVKTEFKTLSQELEATSAKDLTNDQILKIEPLYTKINEEKYFIEHVSTLLNTESYQEEMNQLQKLYEEYSSLLESISPNEDHLSSTPTNLFKILHDKAFGKTVKNKDSAEKINESWCLTYIDLESVKMSVLAPERMAPEKKKNIAIKYVLEQVGSVKEPSKRREILEKIKMQFVPEKYHKFLKGDSLNEKKIWEYSSDSNTKFVEEYYKGRPLVPLAKRLYWLQAGGEERHKRGAEVLKQVFKTLAEVYDIHCIRDFKRFRIYNKQLFLKFLADPNGYLEPFCDHSKTFYFGDYS